MRSQEGSDVGQAVPAADFPGSQAASPPLHKTEELVGRLLKSASTLRGQLNGVLVPENANGISELLDFKRLFQYRNRTFGQDAIEHLAIGIASYDNDRALRLFLL